ncbi:MAG: hypothetical protein WBW44_12805, partial [Solirubrobacterales bacterium]
PSGVSSAWSIDTQPAGDPCSITAGTLNCSFGDLAPGAKVTVTVKAETDFENCTTLDNLATASATNAPDAADDATINCQKPDLKILKTGNGTINAGEDAEFTIEVSNDGPGVAKEVTLSDTLPTGVSGAWSIVEQPDGNPCSITAGTLNCNFGDMDGDSSVTVKVKAATSSSECGTYENVATTSGSNAPETSDEDTVTCQKPSLANLKTAVQPVISAGDTAEFSIKVTNAGPGIAKDVTLVDPLPGGVSGEWTISSQPAGDPCSITANTLNCAFGDLAAQGSVEVTVTAPTAYEACATLVNTATAAATNAPDATDDATIDCQKPNLTVLKSGNGTIDAGDTARFTIQVTNAGPGVAKAVTLNDPLPAGIKGSWSIETQPTGSPCQITGTTLACQFGDMAAGESVTVTVNAATSIQKCGTYDNTATASSSNAPAASGQATIKCKVLKPKIKLKKTANKKKVFPGDVVRYKIWIRNTKKNSVALNVKICDKLPPKMSIVKKDNKAFFENGKLCWNVKRLPYSKKWKKFSYTSKVDQDANEGDKLKNVVTAGGKKATKTVIVKAAPVESTGRVTRVTG